MNTQEITLAIGMFTAVVLTLAVIILIARARLCRCGPAV
jgi:Na+-transporting NADH:ubiquinone oxidoreductase subunit NqrF